MLKEESILSRLIAKVLRLCDSLRILERITFFGGIWLYIILFRLQNKVCVSLKTKRFILITDGLLKHIAAHHICCLNFLVIVDVVAFKDEGARSLQTLFFFRFLIKLTHIIYIPSNEILIFIPCSVAKFCLNLRFN